ncbi:hypothetical protein EMIHUDRAFT_246088, partial [Emiliania huxleyi CCMP1516]|uniref:Thioesterase domain-containing protein n=2 Tax=Emiliania huxleyi TaxID=2903 RepID=A0A0D3IV21_EMIH1
MPRDQAASGRCIDAYRWIRTTRRVASGMSTLLVQTPVDRPHLRLLLFPHAGGSAAAYEGWHDALASRLPVPVEVWAVSPPGRGARAGEAAFPTVAALAQAVLSELVRLELHLAPLAVFGHSLGALTAYELARRMVDARLPPPVCLFASAHEPPSCGMPEAQRGLASLSDAALLRALAAFDFVPVASLEADAADAAE